MRFDLFMLVAGVVLVGGGCGASDVGSASHQPAVPDGAAAPAPVPTFAPELFDITLAPIGPLEPGVGDEAPAPYLGRALYGRVILRPELPALRRVVEASWRLPAAPEMRIAYLIQGEEDTTEKEAAMQTDVSDAFVLTFRVRRRSALFFPNSLLAEGRNVLLAAAAMEEFRRGSRYRYYVFMDADTYSTPAWPTALFRFQAFLLEWEPAVGLPAYGDAPSTRGGGSRPRSVFHFDHIFVAVHAEAAPALLPLDPTHDRNCSWVSQWAFTLLASALFRNHTLMLPSVRVHNPEHGEYPRNDCMEHFAAAAGRLRALAPPDAADCFPAPMVRGHVFNKGMLGPTSYLPWGTPRPKGQGDFRVDYSDASLEMLPSCHKEFSLSVKSAQGPRVQRFCPGCPSNVVLYILQKQIIQNPLWAPTWHELGLTIWTAFEDLPVAGACVAIARRLVELRRQPPIPDVEETFMLLHDELVRIRLPRIARQLRSESLFQDAAGRGFMTRTIGVALMSSNTADLEQPALLSETDVLWLLDILAGRIERLGDRPPRGGAQPGAAPVSDA